MKKYLAIIVLGLISLNIEAQTTEPSDIIKFNDRSQYRGNIKEYKDGEFLSIEVGGNLITIKGDQLNNIKEIGFNKLSYHSISKGFWHELQVGVSVGKSTSFSSNESYPLITATSGYQFNQYVGVGLGSGFQSFSNINIVPIYGSLRGDLLDTRVTPFYYFDIGYGIGVNKKDDFFFGDEEKARGGLLVGSGLGLRFKLRKTYLTTSLGYKHQRTTTTREFLPVFFDTRFAPGGGELTTEKRNYKRVEFKVGIGF